MNNFSRIQVDTHTELNRYPYLFRRISEYYSVIPRYRPLRILSFGCSTGEEILTLRKHFPSANLFGCDINESVLNVAATKCADAQIFLSTPDNIKAHGPFDVILCLSVLCIHGTGSAQLLKEFPFNRFEDIFSDLTSNLLPGGLIAVVNSNYFVSDTKAARELTAIPTPGVPENSYAALYNKDNVNVFSRFDYKYYSLYNKVTDHEILDSSLTDCLFVKGNNLFRELNFPSCYTILDTKTLWFPPEIDWSGVVMFRGRIESTVILANNTTVHLGYIIRRSTNMSHMYVMDKYIIDNT